MKIEALSTLLNLYIVLFCQAFIFFKADTKFKNKMQFMEFFAHIYLQTTLLNFERIAREK